LRLLDAGGEVGVARVGCASRDAVLGCGDDIGGVAVNGEKVTGSENHGAFGGGKVGQKVSKSVAKGCGVVTGLPYWRVEPAELIVVSSSDGLSIASRGGVGDEVVCRVLKGDTAGSLQHVAVPVDGLGVSEQGVVAAVVLCAEAGHTVLRPVARWEAGVLVTAVDLGLVHGDPDWDVFVVASHDQLGICKVIVNNLV